MIAEITTLLELSKTLISLLKETLPMIKDGTKKEKIEEQLKYAERQLAITEATSAKNLGYELCQCTFPPQIMLLVGKELLKCPRCGNEVDKSHQYDGIINRIF